MDSIKTAMEIIANAGEAKSNALTALQKIRQGEYEEAEKNMESARQAIIKAHNLHSELLFYEAEYNDLKVTMLMTHAADHLTSGDIIIELAAEMIYMYKEMRNV